MYTLLVTGDVPSAANYFNPLVRQSIIPCSTGTRPASPTDGMMIYETDTRFFRAWSTADSAWNYVGTNRKLWCRKTADQSRASTTTVTADSDLVIPNVPASTYYWLKGVIGYTADVAADLKGGLFGPSGANFAGAYQGPPSNNTGTTGQITLDFAGLGNGFVLGGGTNSLACQLDGVLYSGTGGTVGWQWAQFASSATATVVLTGSYLHLIPMA